MNLGGRLQPDGQIDAKFVLIADHLLSPLGFRHVVRCDGSQGVFCIILQLRHAQDILCDFS